MVRSRRIGEPIACEGEVLSQGRQRSVPGVIIAVEADRIVGDGGGGADGLRRRRLGAGSGCEDEESEEGCELSHKKIENHERKF